MKREQYEKVNDYLKAHKDATAAEACKELKVGTKQYYSMRYLAMKKGEKVPDIGRGPKTKVEVLNTSGLKTRKPYTKKVQPNGKVAVVIGSVSDVAEILRGLQ